jgi:hypothetical protein
MPRNTLKSFPTAMLRSGLAHFHPASRSVAQPAAGRGDGGTPMPRVHATTAPSTPAPQPAPPAAPGNEGALESEERITVTSAA